MTDSIAPTAASPPERTTTPPTPAEKPRSDLLRRGWLIPAPPLREPPT